MKALTKEQQKLVEQNHNLIYDIAIRKNWDIEEYYGILAIGMCKAAKIYDDSKGEFSTVANRCMENEVYNYWRKLQRKHAIPNDMVISYDTPVKHTGSKDSDKFNVLLSDLFVDKNNYFDGIIVDETLKELFNILKKEKEKKIASLYVNGFNQAEIGEILSLSQQAVCYNLQKIREKWSNYLKDN